MNYIKRTLSGISIYKDDKEYVLNKGLKSFINELCLQNGSSFKGRIDSAKYILKKNANVPIYISIDIILFPTVSIRNIESILVNYKEISHFIEEEKGCLVVFKDSSKLDIKQSFYKLTNLIKNCERFSQYLENEKKVFTLSLYK